MIESAYGSSLDETNASTGCDVFDGRFASPLALLRGRALDWNIRAMQRWCAAKGVQLAPHGKTTLAPELFRMQLAAGAWGMTVANPTQALVALEAGAQRVLIANEVADVAGIRGLARLRQRRRDVELACYVDSIAGVALLNSTLGPASSPDLTLDVLVELGVHGGRTGLRNDDDALQVARAVAASDRLRLAGVAGYEGIVGAPSDARVLEAVDEFCLRLRRFAVVLAAAGLSSQDTERPVIVTAGGSIFFDQVARALGCGDDYEYPTVVVLRPGCYVVHDHGMYQQQTPAARGGDGPRLYPALEVWGRALSVPEPGRAVVDVGRRDISSDAGLPALLGRKIMSGEFAEPLRGEVVSLNDQHAYVELDAGDELRVGDWVGLGVSHPCTTFDKWRRLLLVDDGDRLVSTVMTRF